MINWKKVRETLGYTQTRQSRDFGKWHSLASGYHAAAKVLNNHSDCIPGDTRPFALNAGLSLELIFKAIIAKKGRDIPHNSGGHDLIILSRIAGISLGDKQLSTLELLTETIVWSGRYPAPKKEKGWNDYQDRIVEAHIIRQTIGNVSNVLANPDTFPNWENYLKIWEVALAEMHSVRP